MPIWINENAVELRIYMLIQHESSLTSQRYCGELGTLTFQCRLDGSATLLAPRSRLVNPPRRGHRADLSGGTQVA